MCKHGDDVLLRVPIAAITSHTGEFRWATKPVDRCLARLVNALNNEGLYTGGCCCGHGEPGQQAFIGLHDGTMLTVTHLVDVEAADCTSGKEPEWLPGPASAKGGRDG